MNQMIIRMGRTERLIFSVNREVVDELIEKKWLVDVVFIKQRTLEQAEELGFDVAKFNEKNYPYAKVIVRDSHHR